MTDTQHTPGPWKAKRDELHFGSLSTVVGGARETRQGIDAQLVVQVGGWAGLREQEANTRLIAASPELLEALIACNSYLMGEPGTPGVNVAGLVQSAIAKATGEAHE